MIHDDRCRVIRTKSRMANLPCRSDRNLECNIFSSCGGLKKTKVTLDDIQSGLRVLVHDELAKNRFLRFSGDPGMEEAYLFLGRLKKSRGNGNVDFTKSATQRKSLFTFA